jgi:hypothetical protein
MLKMPMAMIALTAPEDGGDHDGRQQRGEGEDEIVDAHQRLVDKPTARCGKGADRHADTHADADRDQRHGNRVASADHDHRQDVAAEMVGAEPMGQRGCLRLVRYDQPGDVVRRPGVGGDCHRQDQQGDDETGNEGAVPERLGQDVAERLLGDVDVQRHWRLLRRGSTTA